MALPPVAQFWSTENSPVIGASGVRRCHSTRDNLTTRRMTTKRREPIAIIGIGNTLRRDDGVGPLLLDACRYDPMEGCELLQLDGDSKGVVEAWTDRRLAIVVDAVCTGEPAGTVHDLRVDLLGASGDVEAGERYLELAGALSLGRQLGRLPDVLCVFGIEPGDLKRGFGLSPPVAAAMEGLESRVRAAVVGCAESQR